MKVRVWLTALSLIAISVLPVVAQVQTGSILVKVTDAQGGAVPGVTVTLSSPVLVAGTMTTVTDASGINRFPALVPGTYAVKVELQGFRTVLREGLVVARRHEGERARRLRRALSRHMGPDGDGLLYGLRQSRRCQHVRQRAKQQSGVAVAGFTMTGQPVAMAGATWCTMRLSGWLKAEIAATTPIGSFTVQARRPTLAGVRPIGISTPAWLRKSSAALRMPSMARSRLSSGVSRVLVAAPVVPSGVIHVS